MYSTFATNFTLSRDNFYWHYISINYTTEIQKTDPKLTVFQFIAMVCQLFFIL